MRLVPLVYVGVCLLMGVGGTQSPSLNASTFTGPMSFAGGTPPPSHNSTQSPSHNALKSTGPMSFAGGTPPPSHNGSIGSRSLPKG